MQAHRLSVALAALIATLTCISADAATHDLRLLARAPGDLVPARLQSATKLATANLDRTPVSVSWALDGAQALDARPQPFVRDSREYWIDASETELQRGIDLALSAPGAVVRVSPHGNNADAKLVAGDIQLSVAGKRLDDTHAIRNIAGDDELQAAGMDAPQGSVALRLSDSIAAGSVKLAVPAARGNYLVHVFEPASAIALHLGAERDGVSAGQAMRVRASLEGAASIARIGGIVSAPDGYSQDIDFDRQIDGSYAADFTPDPAHAAGPGLWEAHAFATSGGKNATPRDAKTAFAVSAAVARLDGSAERVDAKDGVTVRIGIETTAASRYMVSGVLYGTGVDGALHPAAIAQSAAWLGTGHGTLDLRYDASSIDGALHGPWEMHDLRLVNQADLGLLERRERALALP
jgi:hypothetical protein